jgi:transposase
MVVPDSRLLRKAFEWYLNHGLSVETIHRLVLPAYSLRTVYKLMAEFHKNYSPERLPRHRSRRPKVLDETALAHIQDIVDDNPGFYLDEIQKELAHAHKIRVSTSTICRAMHEPASL